MNSPAKPGVSVVVCCYNSAHVLPRTLVHLAAQAVPDTVPWEVVVVDNASTDATAEVARDTWAAQASDVPFRVVAESEPGLVAARNAGAQAATYEFVLYCDDDNWLAPDYVRLVHEILSERPDVGVVGGFGAPAFEGERPEWFDRYGQYYATGPQAETSGDVTDAKGYVYGAGFALRRSAWTSIQARGFESPVAAFERGSNDIEVCYLMRLAGTRIRYDERLRFQHFLPERRVSWPYALDLIENAHRTGVYMAAYQRVFRASRSGTPYRRPSDQHWMGRAAALGPRWLRTWVAAMKHRNAAWHPAEARERTLRGEWTGWVGIRSEFGALCDRIEEIRVSLHGSPHNGPQ